MWVGMGVRWEWRARGASERQTAKIAGQSLGLVAVRASRRGRVDVTERSGRVAGESDERGIESAGDVIEGHLHRGDVGGIALCGPGKNVSADATGRTVEDPCARVTGGCRGRERLALASKVLLDTSVV